MPWRFGYCILLLSFLLSALPGRAEQAKPIPPQTVTDWTPYLTGLQSADKAKQEEAAKFFVDAGGRSYLVLDPLLKHSDEDIKQQVARIKEQIEARSTKLYEEACAEQVGLRRQPLTTAAIENARQAFLRLAVYTPQNPLRQLGYQNAAELQKTAQDVEAAGQQLAALDKQLQDTPATQGLLRAGLQMERANALKTLQRDADTLAAAQDAAQLSGKDGRFTPAALRFQAEAYLRQEDNPKLEAACRAILTDYPRSLEVKFAHQTLLNLLAAANRGDEAVREAREFLTALPLDQDAQDAVFFYLDELMSETRDYVRAGQLADWLMDTLPLDRLKIEAVNCSAGCNEYVAHDYAKAIRAYTLLHDRFPDLMKAEEMSAALARVKLKQEGKFGQEPGAADPEPAGTFARFLKASRSRDLKALEELVPKDKLKDFTAHLADDMEDLAPALVFADFILKQVVADEAAGKARLLFDYYEPSSNKPKPLTEEAVKEDGKWKINWQDPEEEGEEAEPPAPDAKPAAPQPAAPKTAAPEGQK